MWTATLVKAVKQFGRLDFEIDYLDDSDGEVTRILYCLPSPTKKQIRDLARKEVARLAALKAVVLDLPIGASIDIDPDAVVPPTPPTAEQVARSVWFADYRRLQAMLKVTTAVPALLTPQAQTAIDNLRTSLEADWLNGYLDSV